MSARPVACDGPGFRSEPGEAGWAALRGLLARRDGRRGAVPPVGVMLGGVLTSFALTVGLAGFELLDALLELPVARVVGPEPLARVGDEGLALVGAHRL